MILEIMLRMVYTGSFFRPKPNDIIVDAGANVGIFSLHALALCPTVRIVAYEPFPINFELLVENLKTFGATNVDARHCAVGREKNVVFIQAHGTRSQDHRVIDQTVSHLNTFPVISKSLANVIEEFSGEEIALFKCDIEGGEFALFEGADPRLLYSVKQFAIEFHNHINPNTSQMLVKTLESTHVVVMSDVSPVGYGMIYATRKDLN